MQLILKYKLTIIGIVLGGVAGYLYYYFVGWASGTCAITSKPVNSSLYGAMMGALLLSSFEKDNSSTNKNADNEQ